MADLLEDEGVIRPILQRVQQDDTLQLAIRDGYINIYYRGGSLLRLSEKLAGYYKAEFERKYAKGTLPIPVLPAKVDSVDKSVLWVNAFPTLKNIMDLWLTRHRKAEREFQQLVARENNYSIISNKSDYFIVDIEYSQPKSNSRLDMLAIRWLAGQQRKTGNQCRPVLIEMKYADGALQGRSGILKHLKDIDELIADETRYAMLLQTMQSQFHQLAALDLLKFNRGKSNAVVELNVTDKPEVVFLLANHNPRSGSLKKIFMSPEVESYANTGRFDLRFFVASFAGYGMHADCMLDLQGFLELV